jgi:2-phospho-L-lactate guanylyltransferase
MRDMRGGIVDVLIAARGGRYAKSRCADCLSGSERALLTEAMLADMLDVLVGLNGIQHVHLTTPTPDLARLAEDRDVAVFAESSSTDLNSGLEKARRTLFQQNPSSTLLILPGDLPMIDAQEVQVLCKKVQQGSVTLVPATADGGTAAILARAQANFPLAFGSGSFARHVAAARDAGCRVERVELPSLGLDIDGPSEIEHLLAARPDTRTARFLLGLSRSSS